MIILRLYHELGVNNMDKILYYGAYNFILLYQYREFTENSIENCFIDKITDGNICLLTQLNAQQIHHHIDAKILKMKYCHKAVLLIDLQYFLE